MKSACTTLLPSALRLFGYALGFTLLFVLGCYSFYIMQPGFVSQSVRLEISIYNLIFVLPVVGGTAVCCSLVRNDFLRSLLVICALLVTIPMAVLLVMSSYSSIFFCFISISLLTLFFFTDRMRALCFTPASISFKCIAIISLFPVIALFGEITRLGGWSYFNLNPLEVYKYRFALREVYISPVYGYLFGWVKDVFLPVLILLAVISRSKLFLLVLVVLSIILYGVSSHKSVLVMGGLTWFVYVFFRRIHIYLFFVLIGFLFVHILSAGIVQVYVENFFVHRVFFVPSLLNYMYQEFFLSNGFVYYSDKILSAVFEYQYDLPVPNLIGREFYSRPELLANASMFALGYANLGYFGLLIYLIILFIILFYLKGLSDSYAKQRIVFSINFFPLFYLLTSADLPTTLLTGGLFFSLGLSFLLCSNPAIVKLANHHA